MSYEIARGEQGVLTFEPYKSILLPHWRFRSVAIAEESSKTLKRAFDHYVECEDFVGSDMARKFIQMGMTRARRCNSPPPLSHFLICWFCYMFVGLSCLSLCERDTEGISVRSSLYVLFGRGVFVLLPD